MLSSTRVAASGLATGCEPPASEDRWNDWSGDNGQPVVGVVEPAPTRHGDGSRSMGRVAVIDVDRLRGAVSCRASRCIAHAESEIA